MRYMAGKLMSVAGRLLRLEGVAGEGGWRLVAREVRRGLLKIGGVAAAGDVRRLAGWLVAVVGISKK